MKRSTRVREVGMKLLWIRLIKFHWCSEECTLCPARPRVAFCNELKRGLTQSHSRIGKKRIARTRKDEWLSPVSISTKVILHKITSPNSFQGPPKIRNQLHLSISIVPPDDVPPITATRWRGSRFKPICCLLRYGSFSGQAEVDLRIWLQISTFLHKHGVSSENPSVATQIKGFIPCGEKCTEHKPEWSLKVFLQAA